MKAPEWVIEMMKTGEPVKCMVWDGENKGKRQLTVSAYGVGGGLHYFSDAEKDAGEWFEHAEPIKPTAVRPFRTVEEVEPFFGKVVKSAFGSFVITGASITCCEIIHVYVGNSCEQAGELFEKYTFEDGSPVGITE